MSATKEHFHDQIEAGMRTGSQHKIQWLNLPGYKGETWNPIIGCSKVSDGCKNCYAERMANRLAFNPKTKADYAEVITKGKWNGKTTLAQDGLYKPAGWKSPRVIFVCSMGDLFHETVNFAAIDQVFEQMMLHPRHIYIVLTKRAKRMAEYFMGNEGLGSYLHSESRAHIFLGVTAENQEQAEKRIPFLREIRAAVKFVSIEPMLGPVDLINLNSGRTDAFNPADAGINWVICGGESGHNARPVHPDWVRSLRNQCQASGVPFFFKQWGEFAPFGTTDGRQILPFDFWKYNPEIKEGYIRKGKHLSGNLIDGERWEEYPHIITPTLKGDIQTSSEVQTKAPFRAGGEKQQPL